MQKKDLIESFQKIIWLIDFGVAIRQILTFYFIMLKNDQTFFKNLAVWTLEDFKSMFGHFSTLWNKGLRLEI